MSITANGSVDLFGAVGYTTATITIKVGTPVPTANGGELKIVTPSANTLVTDKNHIYAVTGQSYDTELTNSMGWPIEDTLNLSTSNQPSGLSLDTTEQTLTLDATTGAITSSNDTKLRYAY